MMPAMRDRPSASAAAFGACFNVAATASSISRAASGVTSSGATSPQSAALRRSRGSAATSLVASGGSSLERI